METGGQNEARLRLGGWGRRSNGGQNNTLSPKDVYTLNPGPVNMLTTDVIKHHEMGRLSSVVSLGPE